MYDDVYTNECADNQMYMYVNTNVYEYDNVCKSVRRG